MSQLTRSCRYSRGDVRLILDGWLVEEYRVLRDSMLHEVSTPLFVIHRCKFMSQERKILLHFQVGNIGFTLQSGHRDSRFFTRVDKIVIGEFLKH